MRNSTCLVAAVPHLTIAGTAASARTPALDTAPNSESGVPIERLIAAVAKKTGKRFVLDPRVRGGITLVGEEPADVSYPEFLAVLSVNGYAAVEDGRLVQIVPDANLRQYPTPIITAKDTRPAYEFVTQVIALKYASAAQMIPILRPMIPLYGHLAANPSSNTILISDRFANVRRIEAIIRELDVPEAAKSRTVGSTAGSTDSGPSH